MSTWSIERQIHYPLISEVAPAPRGDQIAFCMREPLLTDERSEFLTHLFVAGPADRVPIQLTYGDHSDTQICWSPDGHFLAFISTRGGRAELRVLRAGGGESWLLATLNGSQISAPRWSRDGSRIAFLAASPPSETTERARRARDDAYSWGSQERNAQIYWVPFSIAPRPLPTPNAVTEPTYHVVGFDWLANGNGFAIAAQPSPNADTWPKSWLATIPLNEGAARPLGTLAIWAAQPHVSPDGLSIAVVASDGPPRWAMAGRVRIFPVGGGAPRTLAETPDTQPTIIGWAPDGTQIYVSEVAGVGACILALPTDGAPPVPLNGPRMFEATRLSSSGQLTVVSEDLDQPNAIVQIDCASGAAREFYRPPLPANWPTSPLPRAEVVQWQSPDGTPIEGIVTYPLNYQVGQAYPLVVVIHGGPTGTYQCSYLGSSAGYAPICSLAERGYATLRCNPRGSSGYGRTFRFANERDWGGGDYHDILAGVDLLIAQGLADPARLAVMGWSYGGFMASWIITQTNRFVAACIGAPVTDPISFNGTADIPSFIPDYFGGEYWEAFENYRRQSPLLHIANIQTPALIQHGEADIRVPLGQGRQLFQALRRRGIATELIVYPRQGHLFSEPRMIIDSRERVLEWLGRYLKEPATSK